MFLFISSKILFMAHVLKIDIEHTLESDLDFVKMQVMVDGQGCGAVDVISGGVGVHGGLIKVDRDS